MSAPEPDNQTHGPVIPDLSGAVPTSAEARAKRRIAVLEEELQTMRQERGTKQRSVTYYLHGCLFLIDPRKKNDLLRCSGQGSSPYGRPLYRLGRLGRRERPQVRGWPGERHGGGHYPRVGRLFFLRHV